MTTNPVMQAILGEKLRQEPSAFGKWCIVRGVKSLPAMPAHVAGFIADLAASGKTMKQIWPLVQEIAASHTSCGAADPTAGGVVADAINAIALIDPPRSWPAAEKARFKALPYDLQCYVVSREAERERVIRNKMNEIAEAKKQLLKEITPHGTVEEQPAENHAA
jgi:hypothetical protein